MAELELIRPLTMPNHRPGQVAELYRRGEEYFCVSTVPDIGDRSGIGAAESMIVDAVGVIAGYATSGEETMAFAADSEGNWLSSTEVAVATGPGSREEVLAQLRGDA